MSDGRVLLVSGRTYLLRAELKALGAWWSPERVGWIAPPETWGAVVRFAEQNGLQAEEIDAPPTPTMLVVTGRTYPVRVELKALGGRWSPARQAWILPTKARERVDALATANGIEVGETSFARPAAPRPEQPSAPQEAPPATPTVRARPFGEVPLSEESRFRGSIVRVPVTTSEGVEYRETTVARVLNRGGLIETRHVLAPEEPLLTVRVSADEIQLVRIVDGRLAQLLQAANALVGKIDNYHVVSIRPPYLLVENGASAVPIPGIVDDVTPYHLLFLRSEGEGSDRTARLVFRVSGDLQTPDRVDAPELLAELRECYRDEIDLWRIPETAPDAPSVEEPAPATEKAAPGEAPDEIPEPEPDEAQGWTLTRIDPATYKPRRLPARAIAALAEGRTPMDARPQQDGWRVSTLNGQAVYTDGYVLLAGVPPQGPVSQTPAADEARIQPVVTSAEAGAVEVTPVAITRSPKDDRQHVWLGQVAVNADRFRFVLQQVPGARFVHNGDALSPAVIRHPDGRFAGLLQPVEIAWVPASIREQIEAWRAAAPAVAERAPKGRREHDGLRPGTRDLIDAVYERLDHGPAIDNRALDALARKCFGGGRGQGRYEIRDAYDAAEAAVNRWVLREGPRLLAGDPHAALGELRDLLGRLPRQTDRTHEQIEFQQFSTPPTHGFVAAKVLCLGSDDLVLEPSAGVGGLAVWARAAGAAVHTNEVAPRRLALLRELGFTPTAHDGEQIHNLLPEGVRPTAVLMNPPFTATGGRVRRHDNRFGLRHLEQALSRLEEGGRLVSIMGRGVALDRSRPRGWWERLTAEYRLRANLGLPGEAYGKYGTDFEQQLVVVDKTGPTPGADFSARLDHVQWGACASLQEAYDAIAFLSTDRQRDPSIGRTALGHPAGPAVRAVGERRGDAPVRDGAAQPGSVRDDADRHPGGDATAGTPGPVPRDESRPAAGDDRGREPARGDAAAAEHAPGGGELAPAPQQPARLPEREDEEGAVYVRYLPQRLSREGLTPHPAHIVESSSMAAVDPPPLTYRSALPREVVSEGRLSDIQYEAVLYAGQRHQQTLPSGARAGFFVGDGTGVGKGRILAGIILDNWEQGRRRALWLSTSDDLLEAARRDLNDIGAARIPLQNIKKYPALEGVGLEGGVIFATYATLIRESKARDGRTRTRLEQIGSWLDDGVIIFDEAHKAKNALAAGRGEPTQTGQAVIALQQNRPQTRVVYASATGATDVRNMAYMTRLGLWGERSPFPGGFDEFLSEVGNGGVGAMELVARELKGAGIYCSRTISFRGVEYGEVYQELTPEQREIYDLSAEAWSVVLRNIDRALETTNGSRVARRVAIQNFYGAQQRFFRQILTAMKVPAAIRETQAALDRGESVVVSLIGTGEAATKRELNRVAAEGREVDDLDFTPRHIIADLVQRAFPVEQYEEKTDPVTGQTTSVRALDAKGRPILNRDALAMREQLLDRLSDFRLPENPLDQLIGHFGADAVAELTGRHRRLLRDPETKKKKYVTRASKGVPLDRVNLHEMELFQAGRKRIAIISDAAATGISLHASNREGNTQRRTHITLELGWSADKQLQTFGRTHRSDQASAPRYVLLSTNVGGERRFSSTLARRLDSLGALTKGQRDAVSAGDLGRFNLETDQGRQALGLLLSRMQNDRPIAGMASSKAALRAMGLLKSDNEGREAVRDEDCNNVPRFLNRLLALPAEPQNALFEEYYRTFEGVVERAREAGMLDLGVEDLGALEARVRESRVVHQNEVTAATTEHYVLDADFPVDSVPWERVEARRKAGGRPDAAITPGYYRQKHSGRVAYAEPTAARTHAVTGAILMGVAISTPRAMRESILDTQEFMEKWESIPLETARAAWAARLAKIGKIETRQVHIVAGAILPLWQRFKTAEATQLSIVRTTTAEGRRIVGIVIPEEQVGRVLEAIGIQRTHHSPEDVLRAGLREGERIELVGGLALERCRVHQEWRLELCGANRYKYDQLRSMGFLEEYIQGSKRFFVPEDRAIEVLSQLLEEHPSVRATTPRPDEFRIETWLGTPLTAERSLAR